MHPRKINVARSGKDIAGRQWTQRTIHCLFQPPHNAAGFGLYAQTGGGSPTDRIRASGHIDFFDVSDAMIEFLLATPAGIFTSTKTTAAWLRQTRVCR
jgi:hypothetical protein